MFIVNSLLFLIVSFKSIMKLYPIMIPMINITTKMPIIILVLFFFNFLMKYEIPYTRIIIEMHTAKNKNIDFPKCTDFICIAHSFDYLSYLRIQSILLKCIFYRIDIPNLRNLSLNQCFSRVKEKSIHRAPVLEQYIPSIL